MNFSNVAQCGTLLGRANTNYTTTHNVFRSGQRAQGVVRMNNGFTVATPASGTGSTHGSIAYMDTCISVSGGIDLRTTNTIFLRADLTLDSRVTFSPYGGKIYGYDRTLILKDDLEIPDFSTFNIGGRIVIDGNGNTITMGNSSKFLIDMDATLTLRNLIIKNIQNQPGNPCLQCSTFDSKLCLDNVILSLTDDFYFNCGQLFIHNDVAVTGTSAFVYQSPNPSFIAPKSTLYFNPETTFDFRPSTTGTPQLLAKDLLFMQDATSQLYLNGCTLKTTTTGLRLTKGQLIFDNKVSLTSNSQLYLTEFYNSGNPIATSDSYTNLIYKTAWSCDGKFVAIAGDNTPGTIKIYRFTGNALTLIATSSSYGTNIRDLAWSPDGKYIAIVGWARTLAIYSFFNNSITLVATSDNYGGTTRGVSWSPDGNYVAMGGDISQTINVYKFTGKSLILEATSPSYSGDIHCLKFSPSGKYIAIGGETTQTLNVYNFTGKNLTLVAQSDNYGYTISNLTWSPDEKHIAIGAGSNNFVWIYNFTSNKLIKVQTADYGGGVASSSWSPDGKYLAVAGNTTQKINLYNFTGNDFSLINQSSNYGGSIQDVSFSPDGNNIAVGGNTVYTLNIYSLRYTSSSEQALSNSIVFGNSALGTNYDVNLTGLAGAQIELDGLMNYDCVS